MGEVKRYRLTAMEFITGKGWVKLPNQGQYHINEQPHKKGGWCKWSDVIKLEKENKRLRELVKEAYISGLNVCDIVFNDLNLKYNDTNKTKSVLWDNSDVKRKLEKGGE